MKAVTTRYKCIAPIGKGGMSKVFLCIDNHIGKKWALKKISCKRFGRNLAQSEIDTLKGLDYPLFPRITDAWYEDDAICIVTDYIDGICMSEALKDGPVPEETALKYFIILLKGIDYLHHKSPPILYLDMKPDNIMLKKDGEIVLIDFGIASSIANSSICMGTVGYAAPEQYNISKTVSEKTDVFSLGITLFVLLTGIKPKRDLRLQRQIIINNTSINNNIKKIILKCINEEPKRRPYPDEILSEVIHYQNSKKHKITAFIMLAIIFITTCFIFKEALNFSITNSEKVTTKTMVEEAKNYIVDGHYSKAGLKVIRSYIDSGILDETVKENFIYEIAMEYFEYYGDYKTAMRYLKMLNKDKYPESVELIRVCEIMTGFDVDKEELTICSNRLLEKSKYILNDDERRRSEELAVFIKRLSEIKKE